MKEIILTRELVALVDDGDYDFISQWKWYAHKTKNTFYAARSFYKDSKQWLVFMHRHLLKPNKETLVDHIDGDGLNNQRVNLRLATHSQNISNQRLGNKNTSSIYKGVSWMKIKKVWVAQIASNGKRYYLGQHRIEVDAAKAYNKMAIELHGEFANLNIL